MSRGYRILLAGDLFAIVALFGFAMGILGQSPESVMFGVIAAGLGVLGFFAMRVWAWIEERP